MGKTLNDPLLLIGKIFALLAQIVMAIGGIALALAIPALLIAQGPIAAELAKEAPHVDLPFPGMWIVAVMAIGLAILAMLFVFFGKLRQIIATVGEGDPFQPANAGRLSLMAWLMLGTQIAVIPATAIGLQIARYAEAFGDDDMSFSIDGGFDFTGLLLVVILFILARVFRHGAAMREDLEGTV